MTLEDCANWSKPATDRQTAVFSSADPRVVRFIETRAREDFAGVREEGMKIWCWWLQFLIRWKVSGNRYCCDQVVPCPQLLCRTMVFKQSLSLRDSILQAAIDSILRVEYDSATWWAWKQHHLSNIPPTAQTDKWQIPKSKKIPLYQFIKVNGVHISTWQH